LSLINHFEFNQNTNIISASELKEYIRLIL
jgi:hypothetical protein